MLKTYLTNLAAELERPRTERQFGSGWLSGSAALLCAVTANLMVVALRNPDLLTTPKLAIVRDSALYRPFLYLVLVAGYVLAALSLALRKDKTPGVAAMDVLGINASTADTGGTRDGRGAGQVVRKRMYDSPHINSTQPSQSLKPPSQAPLRS